jgi:hypothetical protein
MMAILKAGDVQLLQGIILDLLAVGHRFPLELKGM